MCGPRSSRYALSAATLSIWSGPGGPTRFALVGADATSAASLTLASSKSVILSGLGEFRGHICSVPEAEMLWMGALEIVASELETPLLLSAC